MSFFRFFEIKIVTMINLCLIHPFNCIISAPTKSGKTELIKKIVINSKQMIEPPPIQIFWSYSEWQHSYESLLREMPTVKFIEGAPNLEELKQEKSIPKLLILDDLMQDMKNDSRLNELFTRGSHHWNLSIIYIVQNLFFNGIRTSRINCQYILLMKNPSDRLQIKQLGRQLFPGSKHFEESFEDATSKPYGYLLIDLTQTTPDNMRLRSNILPENNGMIIYVPK